jgi:hypothetical protein
VAYGTFYTYSASKEEIFHEVIMSCRRKWSFTSHGVTPQPDRVHCDGIAHCQQSP